jgi:hypothetical protein
MRTNTLVLALLTLVFAATAVAADITGKWTAQVPGREGQTREQVFTFKQEGDKLTGSTTGFQGQEMPISEGKVTGDDVAFKVNMEFNGNQMTFTYTGKVSGDEIKMTRAGRGQPREFVAKRAK